MANQGAKSFNRDLDLKGGARLMKNGTVIIDDAGAIVGDIQATAGSIGLAELASGITPSHITVFAGEVTTTGGDATEVATVTGALASDIVLVTLQAEGGTPVTLDAAAVTSNTITCTFSADPSTDHVWAYQVLRAAA